MKDTLARSCLKVIMISSLLLCTAVPLFSSSSWSQPGPEVQDAKSSANFVPPVLSYSSVFTNYHGYREEAVASWQDANDTVGRIGGWRFYLEEASQPDQPQWPVPPQLFPASLSGDSDNHSGHGGNQ